MNPVRRCALQYPLLLVLPLLCGLTAGPANATPPAQDADAVVRAVEHFVRERLTGLPGRLSIGVEAPDARAALAACAKLEVFAPAGARLLGSTAIGVRCNGPAAWAIFLSANVRLDTETVVAARPIAAGQIIGEQDLATMPADMARLPGGAIFEPAAAVGKRATSAIAPGQPVRQDTLKALTVVDQGQPVRLVAYGNGFSVRGEGKALGSASEGQPVNVKSLSGQLVTGVARSGGLVEVRY